MHNDEFNELPPSDFPPAKKHRLCYSVKILSSTAQETLKLNGDIYGYTARCNVCIYLENTKDEKMNFVITVKSSDQGRCEIQDTAEYYAMVEFVTKLQDNAQTVGVSIDADDLMMQILTHLAIDTTLDINDYATIKEL